MSTTFRIERRWMEHPGGTKFYQVMRFSRMEWDMGKSVSERTVTVFHFAGFKGDRTKLRRPVMGGQIQIKVGDLFMEKFNEKKRDGYEPVDQAMSEFVTTKEFLALGNTLMGAAHMQTILTHLGMRADTGEVNESEDDPSIPFEDTPIEETERPDGWGSW